jgi:hypothetical protein
LAVLGMVLLAAPMALAVALGKQNLLRTEAGNLNESRHFSSGVIENMWMDKVSARWVCHHSLPHDP